MRNRNRWQPSKYVYKKGKLIASRDPKEVNIGSRLIIDLIAGLYDRNLKEYSKGRLLDLGCGKAPLFMAYKDYVIENTCIDWQNTFHKTDYLDIEHDLTKSLPFKDEEFDTILLSDVLEHIPNPDHLWKEMSRILSKDGKIIMNVPFFYWLHEGPHDYYRYTEYALRRFVESSGLRLVKLEVIGGVPEILTDILAKFLQPTPVIGKFLAIAIQCITGILLKKSLGKKVSKRSNRLFPFGYFLVAEKVK